MSSFQYNTIAIVVAGGSGSRFGTEIPKQFLSILSDPLLVWTLRPFQESESIDAFCVVVPQDFVDDVSGWSSKYGLTKLKWVIAGGQERQDSVVEGLENIPSCEIVLVHDGARPIMTAELIDRVIEGARDQGACIPGLQVQETLKKVASGGYVITTVNRNDYATIQTPQGFRYTILAEAVHEAKTDGFYGTDEAMLIERMGFPVRIVDGCRENIKVTTPNDMKLAEALLMARQEGLKS
jgi:2-C-methyl-D-erythritol 4-phosphate cytidylyltransferase